MTVKLGTFGPLPREARGQQVTIRVTLSYSSPTITTVFINGDSQNAVNIMNSTLRAAIVPDVSPLAGRAIALVREVAQTVDPTTALYDKAVALIEELDA